MITFQYPTTDPTSIIYLKSPILGDTLSDGLKTNTHLTMDGSSVSTRRSPSRESIAMTFQNIPRVCDGQVEALDAFLGVVQGRDVKLLYHDGSVWTGKIITNPLEITYPAEDRAEFELVFVGTEIQELRRLELEDGSGFLLLETGYYLLLEENTL